MEEQRALDLICSPWHTKRDISIPVPCTRQKIGTATEIGKDRILQLDMRNLSGAESTLFRVDDRRALLGSGGDYASSPTDTSSQEGRSGYEISGLLQVLANIFNRTFATFNCVNYDTWLGIGCVLIYE